MTELVLRELTTSDERAFLAAVDEFAATDPDWTFALDHDDGAEFADYVRRLRRGKEGLDLPEGWVPSTFLVAAVGDTIVGRVSLRHELNDYLRELGGHIGYGVIASERRKGYGTAILRQSLPLARQLGIERLLVTCDDSNVPSIHIIESYGGVLEDTRPRKAGGLTRRYWIDLRR